MNTTIRLLIVLPLLLLSPLLSLAAQEEVSDSGDEAFSMLVPIVFYTSDTGIAGGGLYQRFFPSGLNMSLAGFYTQRNQVNVFYSSSLFSPEKPWWLQYGGSGRYYPESFYGTGPDTSLEDEEKYVSVGINQYLRAYRRIFDGFYAGPALRDRWIEIVDPDQGGVIETGGVLGADGYQLLAAGAGAGTGRDPVPLGGGFSGAYEAALLYATTLSGDAASAALLESDARLYYYLATPLPALAGHQLALQQVLHLSSGELPFSELPSIGGANSMRGYAADRFRDSTSTLLQVDYRFPIYRKFKGALFAGLGTVGDAPADFGLGGYKPAGGGGLRYQMGPTPDTSFRLDFAITPEGFGVYFTFGEAF